MVLTFPFQITVLKVRYSICEINNLQSLHVSLLK